MGVIGPCPPCPQLVHNCKCHCGSVSRVVRCGAQHYSCGAMCNRLLACGSHKCQDTCHNGIPHKRGFLANLPFLGPCRPCEQQSMQGCVCGREKRLVSCQQLEWQCSRKCLKPFSCGHHVCEQVRWLLFCFFAHQCGQVCHAGPCGECPNSGKRTCPCGKTGVSCVGLANVNLPPHSC